MMHDLVSVSTTAKGALVLCLPYGRLCWKRDSRSDPVIAVRLVYVREKEILRTVSIIVRCRQNAWVLSPNRKDALPQGSFLGVLLLGGSKRSYKSLFARCSLLKLPWPQSGIQTTAEQSIACQHRNSAYHDM